MTGLQSQVYSEAGRPSDRKSDRSTEFVAAPKGFLDEVARAGGWGAALEKMLGDA